MRGIIPLNQGITPRESYTADNPQSTTGTDHELDEHQEVKEAFRATIWWMLLHVNDFRQRHPKPKGNAYCPKYLVNVQHES